MFGSDRLFESLAPVMAYLRADEAARPTHARLLCSDASSLPPPTSQPPLPSVTQHATLSRQSEDMRRYYELLADCVEALQADGAIGAEWQPEELRKRFFPLKHATGPPAPGPPAPGPPAPGPPAPGPSAPGPSAPQLREEPGEKPECVVTVTAQDKSAGRVLEGAQVDDTCNKPPPSLPAGPVHYSHRSLGIGGKPQRVSQKVPQKVPRGIKSRLGQLESSECNRIAALAARQRKQPVAPTCCEQL